MPLDRAIDRQAQRLLLMGAWLFLLGLLTGLVVPAMANPRLGLSSHIEGVLNGMLLLLLGLLWPRLVLTDRWRRIALLCAVYGAFANWAAMLVAAVLDAGAMLTVAAQGRPGSPLAEGTITFGLVSLSIAMLVAGVTLVVGLRRGMTGLGPLPEAVTRSGTKHLR